MEKDKYSHDELIIRQHVADAVACKPVRIGLTEIDEIRERTKGHEFEYNNVIPLLLARIAELEAMLDDSNCVLHAAGEHIAKLEGKPNFITETNPPPMGGKCPWTDMPGDGF